MIGAYKWLEILHISAPVGRFPDRRKPDLALRRQFLVTAIEAADPTGRLVAVASYLGLDWRWIRRRCRELSPHGCRGFARPRSRLLSVSGIDAACQYVAALDGEDND